MARKSTPEKINGPVQFSTRDNWWTLVRRRMPKLWGQCDYQSSTIYVDSRATGAEELATIIHEFTHAHFDELNEDAVCQFEQDLTRLLVTLGYHR